MPPPAELAMLAPTKQVAWVGIEVASSAVGEPTTGNNEITHGNVGESSYRTFTLIIPAGKVAVVVTGLVNEVIQLIPSSTEYWKPFIRSNLSAVIVILPFLRPEQVTLEVIDAVAVNLVPQGIFTSKTWSVTQTDGSW